MVAALAIVGGSLAATVAPASAYGSHHHHRWGGSSTTTSSTTTSSTTTTTTVPTTTSSSTTTVPGTPGLARGHGRTCLVHAAGAHPPGLGAWPGLALGMGARPLPDARSRQGRWRWLPDVHHFVDDDTDVFDHQRLDHQHLHDQHFHDQHLDDQHDARRPQLHGGDGRPCSQPHRLGGQHQRTFGQRRCARQRPGR